MASSGPHVVVFCDLEGVTGVDDPTKFSEQYDPYNVFLTEDVNASVRGLKKGGAEKVYVVDTHSSGRNIRADLLHPAADLVPPSLEVANLLFFCPPRFSDSLEIDIGHKVDAVVRIGAHARRQTKGFMAHTMVSYPPTRLWVNGAETGEIGLYVLWAASRKIPVILFAGDDVAMDEAASLMPSAKRVVTKKSLSRNKCETLPPDSVRKLIETEALEAMRGFRKVPPCDSPANYVTELSWHSIDHAIACSPIPRARIKDESRISYVAETFLELRRFIDTAISLAILHERKELISALRNFENVPEKISQWQNQRRKDIGADWESE